MGQLLFKKCFFDAIRAGTKRTTIRRWSSARLKPGQRAFTPGVGWLIVEAVDVVELSRLSDADALADGFDSLAQMRRVLRKLYPAARANRDGRQWFRVRFRRDERCAPPGASRADGADGAPRASRPPRNAPRRAKAQRRPGPPASRSKPQPASRASDLQRRALVDLLRRSAAAMFA